MFGEELLSILTPILLFFMSLLKTKFCLDVVFKNIPASLFPEMALHVMLLFAL